MATKPRKRQLPPRRKTPDERGVCTLARYSEDLVDEICTRIAAGESWRSICNTGRLPSYSTLYDWRDRHPEFRERLAQARDMAADNCAERALEVAAAATAATVSADRLHVSTLLWHAARGAPRRYGSRAEGRREPQEFIVRVREFVPVERPDGTMFTREILPDGSFVDDEG